MKDFLKEQMNFYDYVMKMTDEEFSVWIGPNVEKYRVTSDQLYDYFKIGDRVWKQKKGIVKVLNKPAPLFDLAGSTKVIDPTSIIASTNSERIVETKHNYVTSPLFTNSTGLSQLGTGISFGGSGGAYGYTASYPQTAISCQSYQRVVSHMPAKLFQDTPPRLFEDTPHGVELGNQIKEQQEKMNDWQKQQHKPSRLDLDSLPPQPMKPQVAKPAFDDDAVEKRCKPFINAAVEYVKQNFKPLLSSLPSIERQIKLLIPIKIDLIRTWGSSALDQESELATDIAKLIKTFSEVRGTELMEKVLTLAKQVIPTHGFFDKLIGTKKEKSALEHKPQLIVLKEELKQLSPKYDQFVKDTSASEQRLMIQLASLVAVREVVGSSNDDSLERVIVERRNILQQAAMQAKLAHLQLIKAQEVIDNQMSRLEQLLTITLPAYEMALAQQK